MEGAETWQSRWKRRQNPPRLRQCVMSEDTGAARDGIEYHGERHGAIPMLILFLHGWNSTPGGIKPTYLKDHGHEVLNPALPDDDFDESVRIAQAEFDRHRPDVVVGSSRGGALAMNIQSGETPLVLLSPAWKRWGSATTVKPGTVILHSKTDETVPLADSQELLRNSGLPESSLIVVGTEHRLDDEESLKKMVEAADGVVRTTTLARTIEQMREACQDDARSVLPVYGIQFNKPVQNRSGVLIAIADQGFLVTAAHKLKAYTDASIPLYVTSPRRGEGGILLVGELHATEDKKIDVAVVKMNCETKTRLDDAGARFLRVTDVDNTATATPAIYLVRGYPLDCNADPMTYSTVLYQGDTTTDSDYPFDPAFHLLLDHSRDLRWRGGQVAHSPRIEGMSGCGIWRLTTRPPSDLAAWSPDERRLVAIQNKCKYGSFLKGTWIRHAFGLIYHRCPELRSVMSSLYLPSRQTHSGNPLV
jgi:hypothetical protein